MILITGLGNPGKEFLKTRHNVGFDIVDSIHSEFNFPKFSEKFNSLYSKKTIYERVIVIQKIYSKTFNKEEKITFEKHRFKKFI